MKNLKSVFLLVFLLVFSLSWSQNKKQFKVQTIAFYNVENLFDTINDPLKDDEKSPMMEIQGDRSKVYKDKISKLARVISDIGYDVSKTSPAIVGVSEVENRQVLEDLIKPSIASIYAIKRRNYFTNLVSKMEISSQKSYSIIAIAI